jgi:hypothetical protein
MGDCCTSCASCTSFICKFALKGALESCGRGEKKSSYERLRRRIKTIEGLEEMALRGSLSIRVQVVGGDRKSQYLSRAWERLGPDREFIVACQAFVITIWRLAQ